MPFQPSWFSRRDLGRTRMRGGLEVRLAKPRKPATRAQGYQRRRSFPRFPESARPNAALVAIPDMDPVSACSRRN